MILSYGSECRWEGHYCAVGDREAEEATKKEIEYQLTKIKQALASQHFVEDGCDDLTKLCEYFGTCKDDPQKADYCPLRTA